MRVAYVVNPRMPRMNIADLQRLLDATRKASREHFGVDVQFATPVEISVGELFSRIPVQSRRSAEAQIYDFKTGKGDPRRFEKAFVAGLEQTGDPTADVLAFVRPYLDRPTESSYAALGAALTRLQLNRIGGWMSVKALDGAPAIDASPYNEFAMWDALAFADLPYELVLTNQLIASVEYASPAAHTAVRGGYTNGITFHNESARFKTTSIWSTFAFTSDDPWVVRMREGESYTAEDAARLAGIAAAHEIGHQLFHFGHPYGQAACLMNPVPMFAYRAWVNGLSARDCPIGGSPAMRPGAAAIYRR